MRFKIEFELGGKKEKKSGHGSFETSSYFLSLSSSSPARLSNYVEAYRISEVVRACVDKINLAAKGIPWYLYQRRGKENVEVSNHLLLKLLHRPSRAYSWPKFLERALGFYLVTGNRYLRKYVGSFRQYGELEILPSQCVQIKTDPNGEPVAYEYFPPRSGKKQTIPLDEILHSKMLNMADDLYGLSPIASVATQIDISNFAAEWTIKLLAKGARPGAVAFIPGALTEDQRNEIKEQWKKYQGPDASETGGLLILETGGGGVRPGDLKLMSFSPKDLELPGSDKIIMRKICSVYHVPSELLGDSENKTYSNQKEARKALYQEATLPHLDELREDLNYWVIPAFDEGGDLFFNYDVSDIDALAADTDALWERAGEAVDRGVLTRNQALELMGYGKSEDPAMDVITVPATVLPLSAIAGGEEE
jgi:HK97 family phage portal protein